VKINFNDYEYIREKLPKTGDFEDWIFHIKNKKTGVEFKYRISITGSALNSKGQMEEIQNAVDTLGDSLVKNWLNEGKEQKIQCRVSTVNIIRRTLGKDESWKGWDTFSQMANEDDFRRYLKTYMSHFRNILKPPNGVEAKAYVSRLHGSLLFLTFRPGEDTFEYRLITDKKIGAILQEIPQKGFAGNLENIDFGGVNRIIEENKIIYIKGDNTHEVWSPEIAEQDAKTEMSMIMEHLKMKSEK
jgi:hypothetical protein